MRYRSSLPPIVARELDHLLGSLRAFLEVSFNDDGTLAAQLTATVSEIGFPVGAIIAYGNAVAPDGWLVCNGDAVSRSGYASLFSSISTTYGVGDGVTTFNLPDLRGKFPLGKATAGTGSTLGGSGGTIDHVHTGPSHTHTTGVPSATVAVQSGAGTTVATDAHTHTTDAQGAGNTGLANPPFQAVTYIILAQ